MLLGYLHFDFRLGVIMYWKNFIFHSQLLQKKVQAVFDYLKN